MSRNRIIVPEAREAVFDVLDDGYAYSAWVVGTRRIRRVTHDWPEIGSSLHHAVGLPGAELHDASTVVERDRPRRMVLEVCFRPTGVARVELDLEETSGGSELTMQEYPRSGPFAQLPRFVTDPLLHARNAWSLRRLRAEVIRKAGHSS